MTLTEFLTARLDEDEAVAKRAEKKRRAPWWSFRFLVNNARPGKSGRISPSARDRGSVAQAIDDGVAAHIARHDPARVLREVEAGRRILARHKPLGDPADYDYGGPPCGEDEHSWPCLTLRAIAAVWSDHPDYDEAWRP